MIHQENQQLIKSVLENFGDHQCYGLLEQWCADWEVGEHCGTPDIRIEGGYVIKTFMLKVWDASKSRSWPWASPSLCMPLDLKLA